MWDKVNDISAQGQAAVGSIPSEMPQWVYVVLTVIILSFCGMAVRKRLKNKDK